LFEVYGRVSLTGQPEKFEIELKSLGIWFSISAYSSQREYFIAVFDNITERKRAEQKMRESEEHFRCVVESAPEGMFIQVDGLFRYLNPAALALFGAETPDQIVGQPLVDRVHPDYHAVVNERTRLMREERQTVPVIEEQYLSLDGTPFDVEVTAAPFSLEGCAGSIVFFRDITERKRADRAMQVLEGQFRQAQKLETVGRLAGGIAHDFNNLLMVIRSYTEMLQDRLPAEDSLRRNTQQIMKAADRAANLTGQMLAFSRKQVISPRVLDLNATVNETTKMLKRLIGEDIELLVSLAEPLWTVRADPDQIVQVLMNLCVNARDAMQ
jgi:PAS domain S-box-containing protein